MHKRYLKSNATTTKSIEVVIKIIKIKRKQYRTQELARKKEDLMTYVTDVVTPYTTRLTDQSPHFLL